MSLKNCILFLFFLLMPFVALIAQCDNSFKFPATTLTLATSINTITNVQWAGDYNVTTGYINGATCTYSSSNNSDFITLRKESDNSVIAKGTTPLTIVYDNTMGNIEMHINKDALCNVENINRTTIIIMNITDDINFRGGNNDGFNNLLLQKSNITDDNIFRGGSNDGFNQLAFQRTSITDDNIFRGGSNDGFNQLAFQRTSITDDNNFRGGNNDGFSTVFLPLNSITDSFSYKGGNDDGFATILFNKINITDVNSFRGGSGDGFTYVFLNKINIIDTVAFTGGIGRGETQIKFTHITCDGVVATWLGTVSNAWEDSKNWDCDLLPGINSTVIIPSLVPNFPKVNFNYEIKKLILNNNSSITIQPGVLLKLNGL